MGEGPVEGLVGADQPGGLPGGGVPAVVPDEQKHVRHDLRRARRGGDEKEHDAPRRDSSAPARGRLHLAPGHRRPAPAGVEAVRAGDLHVSQARAGSLLRHTRRFDAEVSAVAERGEDEAYQGRVRERFGNTERGRRNVHHARANHCS